LEASERAPVNILLVDDQQAKLLSYEASLAGLGENLLTATTPTEALAILLRTEVAVMVVDVCMPEMDGFELMNMVRRHPRFRDTAIILVSAIQVSDLDRLRGYDSGAMDYVQVPYVPELLRAKVRVFADLFRKTRQLQELNEDLEELVQERTAELRRSNRDLEQFAYVASHDLQEPLRMISSFLQLLKDRSDGRLDDDSNEFVQFAMEGSQRMHAMVNDLLAYARVSTDPRPFGLVDCGEALDQAVANLSLAIQESGATVERSSMPTLRGDQAQIVQVFQNLIGNAIKFRRPDVTPRISVHAERGNHEWIFSVEDNGIGLDPVFAERIFQVFQRLHARDRYPGTGIGLSLCKKIVERHRGRVWVESAPDEGSAFHFTLADLVETSERPRADARRQEVEAGPDPRTP